jgi:hypothetical protein
MLVFWTILGSGALLTVALCFVVAVVPAPRIGRHHQPLVVKHHRQRRRGRRRIPPTCPMPPERTAGVPRVTCAP